MSAINDFSDFASDNPVTKYVAKYGRLYQAYLDRTVPHVGGRWASFGGLLVLFMLRIVMAQGWYIVCYGLGIYLLNLFLLFLTPKFDPSLEQELRNEDIEEGEVGASTDDAASASASKSLDEDGEFRPFIRRLPEFKFWHNATRATVLAIFCTFFEFFDIPVFWPILLLYFIALFILTMRRQLQHMIKYKYLPFDLGKTTYSRSA